MKSTLKGSELFQNKWLHSGNNVSTAQSWCKFKSGTFLQFLPKICTVTCEIYATWNCTHYFVDILSSACTAAQNHTRAEIMFCISKLYTSLLWSEHTKCFPLMGKCWLLPPLSQTSLYLWMMTKVTQQVERQSSPCIRPWRPIGLWDVEAPIFSR
jgi:hypothetical protein